MKAAVVYGQGDLRLEDVPTPEVPKDSIRIKVEACAICGTDMRIYRKGDYRASYPVIVGHEIAGVVDAVDKSVTSVKVGDKVCVAPGHGCGKCRMCLSGQPNVCIDPFPSLGYKVNGGFAEYMAVPENIFRLGFVNPIPENLTFEQASMSEIIACCLNGQKNSPVRKGDVVVIMGSGPAGLIQSVLARLNGASKIIFTEISKARLEMAAEKFEMDRGIVLGEDDPKEIIAEETNGSGADVIFVCAPSRAAQEMATELIGPRGRINFFGGLPKDDCIVKVDANVLHYKEFFIAGTSSSLPETNIEALELLSSRKVDPDLLITASFSLEKVHEAFDVAEARGGIKVVVKP